MMQTRCRTGAVREQGGLRVMGLRGLLLLGLAGLLLGLAGCAGNPAKTANDANKAAPATKKMPMIAPPEVAKNAEGQACPPRPPQLTRALVRQAEADAADHGFLWRITRDGHSSYLYGTMHVSKPAWMFPGPRVRAAMRQADTVALELDVMDPHIQQQVKQEAAALHAEPLPPKLQARVRKVAERLCVSYPALSAAPVELQLAELDLAFAGKDGLYPQFAIDSVLAALSHRANKRVVSLETAAIQMHALIMPSRQDLLAYVEDGLAELESARGRVLFARMANAWATSDYRTMGKYREWCECMRTPIERKVMHRMLNARNPEMAAKIDALHRKGARVFVAVGSLHLFGKIGLPALLKQKGYAVERIALAAVRVSSRARAMASLTGASPSGASLAGAPAERQYSAVN